MLPDEPTPISEVWAARLLEMCPDGVAVVNRDGVIVYANQRCAEQQGFEHPGDMLGKYALDLIAPEDRGRAREAWNSMPQRGQSRQVKYNILRTDGSSIPVEVNVSALEDDAGALEGFLCLIRDISERQRAAEALEQQALHDALTGLPNRVLLGDRLRQAVLAAARDGTPVGLLVMDLDRFKEVNDTFGHQYGDLLLRQVGPRLAGVLRESDTVARMGGDEFAVLLPNTDVRGAEQTADRLLRSLAHPIEVEGQLLDVGASIGIALYPDHGTRDSALLRAADVAMYVAKRHHVGYAVYRTDLDDNTPNRLRLTGDLHRALERGELRLVFQPIVRLRDGRCSHVEAYIRWQHPEFGLLSPEAFIPLAEHTGLIKAISLWVLRAAMQHARAWHEHGVTLPVAVNLSQRGLHDPHLTASIARLIRQMAVAPTWLELEITESAVMADPDRSMETLGRLRAMGVRVAIDDFGTGYSSLAYFQRLPVDAIKIDGSFVRDLVLGRESAFIVRSIIDLGHSRGLRVVGEGVESETALDVLRALGCDQAQGYFLAEPMPGEEIVAWAADRGIVSDPSHPPRRTT